MKLFMGLVLTLMLSSIALAEEVTQQLGPYNVSLDMKSNMKYQIQTSEPIESPTFTAYPMPLFTDNSTWSQIVIYENKNPTDSTPAVEKSITGLTLMLSGFNVTKSEDKVIDGRHYAQYVVTEYGIANLAPLSEKERPLALIKIAHPKFRAELLKAAKKRLRF